MWLRNLKLCPYKCIKKQNSLPAIITNILLIKNILIKTKNRKDNLKLKEILKYVDFAL